MTRTLAILTADIHLRDDQPKCRLDDFILTQKRKLNWLSKLQKKEGGFIIDAGDLFHKWKVSPYLINFALDTLPEVFFTIPGNHDLPQHSLELINQSGFGVVNNAGRLTLIDKSAPLLGGYSRDTDDITPLICNDIWMHPFPWGTEITDVKEKHKIDIAVIHTMTYVGSKPYPNCQDLDAESLLDKYKGYDIIVTGHNHKCFIIEKNGRYLVNPGSLTRQSADQIDYKPAVHLLKEDNGKLFIESVPVPIEDGVITNKHLQNKKSVDERMNAFVDSIVGDFEVGLSFENNIEEFCRNEKTKKPVEEALLKAMGK